MKYLLVLALMMAGCATSVDVTKLDDKHECSSPGKTPELFIKGDKPSKSYKKIALVNASGEDTKDSKLYEILKEKGKEICADALIVQDIGNQSETTGVPTYGGGMFIGSSNLTIIRALAVRYEQ